MTRRRRRAALEQALRRLEEVQGLPEGELVSALADDSDAALRAKVETSLALARDLVHRAAAGQLPDPEGVTIDQLPDRELAARLDAILQALADLFEVAVALPRELPAVTPAFPNGTALVPSAFPLQAALAAIHNAREAAGAWVRDEQGRPVYTFRQPQGTAFVTLEPPGDDGLPPDQAAREALWQQFRHLGDLDGDVLLAALAQWMRARDAQGYAWVTGEAILDYRGVEARRQANAPGGKRYRRGHRAEDVDAVADCWSRLRLVYLHLQNVAYREVPEGKGGRRGRPRTARYSLKTELLHVPDILTQRQLDGREAAVAWRFRPGRWVAPYLEAPNQQLALLLQRALGYDPYRERWEKRLARYFFFHLRIKATAGAEAPTRRNVGAVLHELGLADAFDRRNPERTVRRFAAAMDRLRDDGQIGGWRLTDEAQAWYDGARTARGWLDDWFGVEGKGGVAVMEVTPPAAAVEQYQRLAARAQQARLDAATAAARPRKPPETRAD